MINIAVRRRWGHGKRLADWNTLIRLDTPLMFFCLAYSSLHILRHCQFAFFWQWQEFWAAVSNRFLLAVVWSHGFSAIYSQLINNELKGEDGTAMVSCYKFDLCCSVWGDRT